MNYPLANCTAGMFGRRVRAHRDQGWSQGWVWPCTSWTSLNMGNAVAEIHSKILDVCPPSAENIFQFSCSFWEKLVKLYVGATPSPPSPNFQPRGNPGSATVMVNCFTWEAVYEQTDTHTRLKTWPSCKFVGGRYFRFTSISIKNLVNLDGIKFENENYYLE